MKALISFCLLFLTLSAYAGVSGGGTGPRPGMGVFMSAPSVDFVKSIDFDLSGNVQFQFKGFEKAQVEVHAVNIQDISEKYLEALKRSQESRKWEPVQIEGLEN